jgi:hypothetical protein
MKTSRVVMSLFVALFIGHQCAMAQEKIGRITLAKSADIKAIDYRIRVKFNLDDHNYQVTIKNLTTSTEVSHILQHVLPADLSNLLLAQIKKESEMETIPDQLRESINTLVKNEYAEIMEIAFMPEDDGQKIAVVSVSDSAMCYKYNDTTAVKMKVNKVRLVFENGFITGIHALVSYNGEDYVYSNIISMGIATRRGIQLLSNQRLFNQNTPRSDGSHFIVGEFLRYHNLIEVGTNDYSPRKQSVDVFPGKELVLRKDPSKDLFELQVYTDLAGINQDNPNGLVQFEVEKRINVNTHRRPSIWNSGLGSVTYIKPAFAVTKVEENNRFAPLATGLLGDSSVRYISPLQLDRYNIAYGDVAVNMIDFDFPAMAFTIDLIGGLSHARVKDSTESGVRNEAVNSLYWGGNVAFLFNPDRRWSFGVSTQMVNFNPLNANFNYYSLRDGELEEANTWLNTIKMEASWQLSKKTKLFGRIRFHHELDNWNNNYAEFQLGTAISLSSKVK